MYNLYMHCNMYYLLRSRVYMWSLTNCWIHAYITTTTIVITKNNIISSIIIHLSYKSITNFINYYEKEVSRPYCTSIDVHMQGGRRGIPVFIYEYLSENLVIRRIYHLVYLVYIRLDTIRLPAGSRSDRIPGT